MDWQPIETAPKDGSWFLALLPKDEWMCVWHPIELCFWNTGRYDFAEYGGFWAETDVSEEIHPTHWLPVPPFPDGVHWAYPPETEASGRDGNFTK